MPIHVAKSKPSKPTSPPIGPLPITVPTKEAAKPLGLSPVTLRNWRSKGIGPRYVHASTKNSPVLYRYADLVSWVDGLRD